MSVFRGALAATETHGAIVQMPNSRSFVVPERCNERGVRCRSDEVGGVQQKDGVRELLVQQDCEGLVCSFQVLVRDASGGGVCVGLAPPGELLPVSIDGSSSVDRARRCFIYSSVGDIMANLCTSSSLGSLCIHAEGYEAFDTVGCVVDMRTTHGAEPGSCRILFTKNGLVVGEVPALRDTVLSLRPSVTLVGAGTTATLYAHSQIPLVLGGLTAARPASMGRIVEADDCIHASGDRGGAQDEFGSFTLVSDDGDEQGNEGERHMSWGSITLDTTCHSALSGGQAGEAARLDQLQGTAEQAGAGGEAGKEHVKRQVTREVERLRAEHRAEVGEREARMEEMAERHEAALRAKEEEWKSHAEGLEARQRQEAARCAMLENAVREGRRRERSLMASLQEEQTAGRALRARLRELSGALRRADAVKPLREGGKGEVAEMRKSLEEAVVRFARALNDRDDGRKRDAGDLCGHAPDGEAGEGGAEAPCPPPGARRAPGMPTKASTEGQPAGEGGPPAEASGAEVLDAPGAGCMGGPSAQGGGEGAAASKSPGYASPRLRESPGGLVPPHHHQQRPLAEEHAPPERSVEGLSPPPSDGLSLANGARAALAAEPLRGLFKTPGDGAPVLGRPPAAPAARDQRVPLPGGCVTASLVAASRGEKHQGERGGPEPQKPGTACLETPFALPNAISPRVLFAGRAWGEAAHAAKLGPLAAAQPLGIDSMRTCSFRC